MTNLMGIRVGQEVPPGFVKMSKHAVCIECGATFNIIHRQEFADDSLVEAQIEALVVVLRGEHVDEKFKDHIECYDLD